MFTVPVDKFYVICVISNPARYHTRYRLFHRFEQHMQDVGAKLITTEIAFGNRPFLVTDRNYKYDFQLRTDQEIWLKENAINLTIQRLNHIDPDWKAVAWIDADIHFQRQDIIMETVQQLQHYDVVQMFSHVTDLGPNYEPVLHQNGFVWSYHQNNFEPPASSGFMPNKKGIKEIVEKYPINHPGHRPDPYESPLPPYGDDPPPYGDDPPPYGDDPPYGGDPKDIIIQGERKKKVPVDNGGTWIKGTFWHCGYAWAARRSALDKVPLFDMAILGSSDHHMAMGLIGQIERSIPTNISAPYRAFCLNWQKIAEQHIRRNVGYVPGLISHYWHGKKKDRRYVDRWKILTENNFDPNMDISRDTQGLYRLNTHDGARQIRLRDQCRAYFRMRNEDSVDMEE